MVTKSRCRLLHQRKAIFHNQLSSEHSEYVSLNFWYKATFTGFGEYLYSSSKLQKDKNLLNWWIIFRQNKWNCHTKVIIIYFLGVCEIKFIIKSVVAFKKSSEINIKNSNMQIGGCFPSSVWPCLTVAFWWHHIPLPSVTSKFLTTPAFRLRQFHTVLLIHNK